MQTLQQSINPAYLVSKAKNQSLFTRFINWANGQEPFRYGWLGVILAAHGCFLTPATVFVVLYSGNNIWMFVTAVTVMAMSLVTNLAAMPTKITIPVFFAGILIDLAIVAISLLNGFSYF
jgi:hypothetical protein